MFVPLHPQTKSIGLKIRVSPVRFLEVPLLLSLARFRVMAAGFSFSIEH